MGDFKAALQSKQRALDIRIKLFGEEHQSTVDCYYSLGKTQHELDDFKACAAVYCYQRVLDIRIKPFGKDHRRTAASNRKVEKTQRVLDGLKGRRK